MISVDRLNTLLKNLEAIKSQRDRLLGEEAQLLKSKDELKQEFIKQGVTIEGLPVLEKQLEENIKKIETETTKILDELQGKL